MKIGIITHKLVRGDGQGRVNYEIARKALTAGHQVIAIAMEVAPELQEEPNFDWVKVPVAALPTYLLREHSFAIAAAIWLLCNRDECDVLHANGFVTWHAGDLNTAHFVHSGFLRSGHYPFRPWQGVYAAYQSFYTGFNALLERFIFRRAGMVVAVSRKVAEELMALGVSETRIRVIYNGVDLDEFRPGYSIRRVLGLPEGKTMALFAGDLRTPRKNLDSVLRALVKVPEVHLAVAGALEGSPFPTLAESLSLSDRVHFLGKRTDMPALMRAADFFIFPSRYEPLGLVLMEAMASGLPVITARCTGGAEMLTAASGIVLEDPDNVECLAEAIQLLRDQPELRYSMGRAARCEIEHFTWCHMAESYLEAYREVACA